MMEELTSDDELLLFAEKTLGEDCETFVKSVVGKYVVSRSLDEIEEYIQKIKTARAQDVIDLQIKWQIAEKGLVWIYQAIKAGKEATIQLEEEING